MPRELFDHLAAAFGGGPDREMAFEQGAMQKARTEEALQRARLTQQKAIARSRLQGGNFAELDPLDVLLGELGSDYAGVQQGRLRGQEYGFRERIADPSTDMTARQYAAQAVAGRPQNYLSPMGRGFYTDIRAPEEGVQATELGEITKEAEQALIEQRRRTSAPRPVVALDPDTQEPVYVAPGESYGMQPPPRGGSPMSLEDVAIRALAQATGRDASWLYDNPEVAVQELRRIFGQQESLEETTDGGQEDEFGYEPGMIYADAQGNRARYLGNNRWEEL